MLGGDADREISRAHARELMARGARDDADLPGAIDANDADSSNQTGRATSGRAPATVPSAAPTQRRGKRV